MDLSEVFTAQVRGLQAIYPEAHEALKNWAAWSRDRSGIFPAGITAPSLWDQFKRDENEDWGEEQPQVQVPEAPVKAEAAEKQPYDERAGVILDERIHGPGGLPEYQRLVLKVAYVSTALPEDQFPRACGCPPHAFTERLEAALRFVGRFV